MKVEVEGKEGFIENSFGDRAIIPKDKWGEVQKMIDEGCYDCIDRFVANLPKYSDYAQDGSVYPDDPWNTDGNILAFRKTFKAKFGEEPSRDINEARYDYDAAIKAGVRPIYDWNDGLYHWDSKYKTDDHPNRYVNGIDTKANISPPDQRSPSGSSEVPEVSDLSLNSLNNPQMVNPSLGQEQIGTIGNAFSYYQGEELKKYQDEQVKKTRKIEPIVDAITGDSIPIPSSKTKLPNDVKSIISQKKLDKNFKTFKGKYYVFSKEDSNLYVFDKNHNLLDFTIAGRGKVKGDEMNRANPESERAGIYATTPAGSYKLSPAFNEEQNYDTYGTNVYSMLPNKTTPQSKNLAIHGIYKNELEFRKAILENPNIKDKLMSWGCINCDKDWLNSEMNKPNRGDSLFVTKEPIRPDISKPISETSDKIVTKKRPTLLEALSSKTETNVSDIKQSQNYDDMSFGEAFKRNRKSLGANQEFVWRGKRYTTNLANEATGKSRQ